MAATHPAVQARRFTSVLENTTDVVLIAAPNGDPLYANGAARALLGDELLNSGHFDVLSLLPARARSAIESPLPVIGTPRSWSGELALASAAGPVVALWVAVTAHRDRDGRLEHVACIGRDLTERKRFESELAHQATHDALTGLPNRVLLLDRLALAMAQQARRVDSLAVLFCDLDQFKVVNDSLGHDVGDRLLIAITERIVAAVRPGDTVARFGGDEFVILCDHLASDADALQIAQRIAEVVTAPVDIDEHELVISTSVGIAFHRVTHDRPEDLIRDADVAMYRAKERGRNRYEVFNDLLRAKALVRLDMEWALRRALERNEFVVFYQPKIDLNSGAVCGVEALLRWHHPDRGLLLPGEFIGLAEETGLIVPIGSCVLRHACESLRHWTETFHDLESLELSVNLSGRQFARVDVVTIVRDVLESTGIAPARLVLEMTESVLMADASETVQLLRALKDLGVRLAVDDFGTGYSSLAYLRRFPVDIVKIDRAFVAGLGHSVEDTEIVRLVTTLARSLHLQTVAEGVEEPEQIIELREMGCDRAQGFHLHAPMSSTALEDLFERTVGRQRRA